MQGIASSLNVVKNLMDSVGAKEFMARTNVSIRQFADKPGQPVDVWEPLGRNEWWDPEGTVSLLGVVSVQLGPTCESVWQTAWP